MVIEEARGMWGGAKECRQSLEAEKGKKTDSHLEPPKSCSLVLYLCHVCVSHFIKIW